ncbi:2-phosphosulfolactate phosphatase [Thermogymnomonas acidicola]|uniref:2-phosphosulfolactate phosphatase n=1 Tax=Thermogymnomonas acidicola TaxID=399579 RepID=UPI00094682BF|nr:2-phosphosulfolactate phosphatase [Thermogymnomonas acidicola]
MEVVIEDGRNQKDFEEGTRVLVDIFRSTTSIPIILHRGGATRVIPTGSVSVARAMKREDPKRVLVGERFGLKVPGFDYNNSPPSELMGADLQGREVIFTSTNGTKVLERIRNRGGRVFLGGSFVNFSKTVDAVSGGDRVFITLSNRPDGGEADEDRIFGEFIREKLEGGETLTSGATLRWSGGGAGGAPGACHDGWPDGHRGSPLPRFCARDGCTQR